ncbi:MAG TPA: hypothetical protein DCP91_08315 [Eggerthellaceae bacterium]|nr:hypothetical protein [Eggerthellaceae bacterium]
MGKIFSFVTGAAIGALAALAFAPQAGEQTRALVAEKAGALAGEAKDFGAGFPGSAKDLLDKGADMLKDAPAKAQGMTGGGAAAASDNDELREKIEAARRRIAAQVMENAEQGKAVEVAVDEAKEEAAE